MTHIRQFRHESRKFEVFVVTTRVKRFDCKEHANLKSGCQAHIRVRCSQKNRMNRVSQAIESNESNQLEKNCITATTIKMTMEIKCAYTQYIRGL